MVAQGPVRFEEIPILRYQTTSNLRSYCNPLFNSVPIDLVQILHVLSKRFAVVRIDQPATTRSLPRYRLSCTELPSLWYRLTAIVTRALCSSVGHL